MKSSFPVIILSISPSSGPVAAGGGEGQRADCLRDSQAFSKFNFLKCNMSSSYLFANRLSPGCPHRTDMDKTLMMVAQGVRVVPGSAEQGGGIVGCTG